MVKDNAHSLSQNIDIDITFSNKKFDSGTYTPPCDRIPIVPPVYKTRTVPTEEHVGSDKAASIKAGVD